MAQPELVARLVIENKQALDAIQQVQREGVDAMEHVADAVDMVPLRFVGWDRAIQLVGDALMHVQDQLERAVELAAEHADVNSAAFREFGELQKLYDSFLTTLGTLLLENQDLADAFEKMQVVLTQAVDSGMLEELVDDIGKIASAAADVALFLQQWEISFADIGADIATTGLTRLFREAADAVNDLTGGEDEASEAADVFRDRQADVNKELGETTEQANEAADALERMAEETQTLVDAENALAQSVAATDAAEQAAHDKRKKRLEELRDWVKETRDRIEKKREMIADTQESIADAYLLASDEDKKYYEQAFANIDEWVAKTLSGYENTQQAFDQWMAHQKAAANERVQLYEIYANATDNRFKWWLEQQYAGIESWKEEHFQATASVEDKLIRMYQETTGANITSGFFDVAAAVETIGDKGENALRRMADAAGVFIDQIERGTGGATLRSTVALENSGINIGGYVKTLKGLGFSDERVYQQLGISDEGAGKIGREVAIALSGFVDNDGTLMLARGGVR